MAAARMRGKGDACACPHWGTMRLVCLGPTTQQATQMLRCTASKNECQGGSADRCPEPSGDTIDATGARLLANARVKDQGCLFADSRCVEEHLHIRDQS